MESIRELLIDEMRDLYDAEKQLVKALPKVVKASSNPDLSSAFEKHLEETRGHVLRLEQAFDLLGERPKSKACAAMKGLIEETSEAANDGMAEPLTDSAIICAAQKVEHYEIAGYGTLSAWAKSLGLGEVAELLDQTLQEEKAANDSLTDVAGEILASAATGESEDESDMDMRKGPSPKNGKAMSSRRAG